MVPSKTSTINPSSLVSGLVPRKPGITRGCRIFVNGRLITELIGGREVLSLVIDLARDPARSEETRLGRLEYGAVPRPNGQDPTHDTVVWYHAGGAVTLPFALIDDMLYIGVVAQERFNERHPVYNPTGMVENAPRGIHDPDVATRKKAAAGELAEEVGVFEGELVRLEGGNTTMDSAWHAHTDELEDGQSVGQGGVTFFAVAVNRAALIENGDSSYVFREDVAASRKGGDPAFEKIAGCRFIPWSDAVRLRDAFTAIGVARLMAQLVKFNSAEFYFDRAMISDRDDAADDEDEPSAG